MSKLFISVVVSVAVLFAACSSRASSAGSEGPSAVVERFYDKIQSDDYQAAAMCIYYDGDDPGKDAEMMTEMLRDYMAPALKKLGKFSMETVSEKLSDNAEEATVEIRLSRGDGEADTDQVKLRKMNGEWRMLPAF